MAQALEKLFRQKLSQMPQEEQVVGGKERIKKGKQEKIYVLILSFSVIHIWMLVYGCIRMMTGTK